MTGRSGWAPRRSVMRKFFAFVFATGLAGAVLAAQGPSAGDLYQDALHVQEVKGDLTRAIALYQSLVTRFASDRAVAPKALFQLAACYEKLGKPEASATYQRIVRDFSDAKGIAAAARTRLTALGSGTAQVGVLTPRRLTSIDKIGRASCRERV